MRWVGRSEPAPKPTAGGAAARRRGCGHRLLSARGPKGPEPIHTADRFSGSDLSAVLSRVAFRQSCSPGHARPSVSSSQWRRRCRLANSKFDAAPAIYLFSTNAALSCARAVCPDEIRRVLQGPRVGVLVSSTRCRPGERAPKLRMQKKKMLEYFPVAFQRKPYYASYLEEDLDRGGVRGFQGPERGLRRFLEVLSYPRNP